MTYDTGQCLRCGYCCRKALCLMGWANGAQPEDEPCRFLIGERPGEHACQLIIDHPEWADEVAIGGGCSSTLYNNVREQAREHLGVAKRPFMPFII